MALRLHSTLGREKKTLSPLVSGEVRVYVCGVTVYDLCHIGHARSALVFDVLRRHLEWTGFRVRFVKNFTDVDDKIIRRAQVEGTTAEAIAERYIREATEDMAALNIRPPDVEPRATEHIPQMVSLIEKLIEKGAAYTVGGDVYYEVRRFPRYGALSGKNLEELRAGARVEVDERKRDPLDFALWKAAKPGEPSWPSPWGPGRPGWHIECSAMAMHYLGESFDIHAGGEDLVFPHHENEIAQSEAATGLPFARVWVHNAFVDLGGEKMSKSKGNILTVKELVRQFNPDTLRLFLLGTHYRHPLEWDPGRVAEATRALNRFRGLFEIASRLHPTSAPVPDEVLAEVARATERFRAALDDDLNTPQALGVLFDLARILYTCRSQAGDLRPFLHGVGQLQELGAVLGLFETIRPSAEPPPRLREQIEELIRRRDSARIRRQWGEADQLRRELQALGVVVEDTREGSVWKWRT